MSAPLGAYRDKLRVTLAMTEPVPANDPEPVPNFRKFSASAAFRTVLYAAIYILLAFLGGVWGIGLALALRELRRYWFRRRLSIQLARQFAMGSARALGGRILQSPIARGHLLELALLAFSALGFGLLRAKH